MNKHKYKQTNEQNKQTNELWQKMDLPERRTSNSKET
jgi:hypothetical protein